MGKTAIEWTERTWNPTRGCRRVSPGCGGAAGEGGCYAERTAARFCGPGGSYEGLVQIGKNGPRWTGTGRLIPETLAEPLSWREPSRVFVDSMSDLFFEEFSNEEIAAVFGVMAACPKRTFQVLTKRAKRMREWFAWALGQSCHGNSVAELCRSEALERVPGAIKSDGSSPPGPHWKLMGFDLRWPLPNVWIGVSVENQRYADERVPLLLDTPAAVRFVSYEPALGPVDFTRLPANLPPRVGDYFCALTGRPWDPNWDHDDRIVYPRLDWVIVGGESGPGRRPFDLVWLERVVKDCEGTGTALFVKQDAGPAPGKKGRIPDALWALKQFPRGAS